MLTAEAVTRYIKCNLWSVVLSLLYKNRAIVLELVSVPQFITFGTRTDKKPLMFQTRIDQDTITNL